MEKSPDAQDELAWERQRWEKEHSVPSKPSPKNEPPKKEPPPQLAVPTIKTLQNDVASTIRTGKQSMVSIAVAKKKREHAEEGLTIGKDEPRHGKDILVVLGTALVLASISGFLFWTNPGRTLIGLEERISVPSFNTSTTTPSELIVSSPISSQNKKVIDIAGTPDALSLIQADINAHPEEETLHEIVLASGETRVTAQEFSKLWAFNMPQMLSRVLGEEFSVGTYGDVPFVVFTVSRTDNAIAGMLSWEKAISEDFSVLGGKNLISSASFSDKKLDGINVRAQTGGLIYTFPIDGKVIIAGDEETLGVVREVFGI